MTISERILKEIKKKGITQRSLASMLDVNPSTVCTWLKYGAESIPSAYIIPISEMLDIDPLELLSGVPSQKEIGELTENETRLLDTFRKLDWEGSMLVIGTAIKELRRIQGDESNREGKIEVG